MYRKFKPLNIPDGWEQYWSKYPNGYTIMESLIDWISQVNDMVNNQNELTDTVKSFGERIDDFINQFGAELQKEVQELLTEWQTSGFLDVVISEALQWQLDDYIATNEQDKLSLTAQLQQTARKLTYTNLTEYGSLSDKETDETELVQTVLNDLTPPSILVIPVGTKWNYRQITHPFNITIIDESTYDWNLDMWTAQQKVLVNADEAGSKNANETIFGSPYHPAYVVDVYDPTGRASYLFRRNGSATWQILSDLYNNDQLFAIKDTGSNPDRMVFEILGGNDSNNEVAFNGVPAKGVTMVTRSRVENTNIHRIYSSSEEYGTMEQYYAGNTEKQRINYEADTGNIVISFRNTGKTITLNANGYMVQNVRISSGSPIGVMDINYFGEEVYDSVNKVWYKAQSSSGNSSWQNISNRIPTITNGNPVGSVEINYFGQETYDSVNGIWYKAISKSGTNGWIALNS